MGRGGGGWGGGEGEGEGKVSSVSKPRPRSQKWSGRGVYGLSMGKEEEGGWGRPVSGEVDFREGRRGWGGSALAGKEERIIRDYLVGVCFT